MVRRAEMLDIEWILKEAKEFADFYGSKIRLDDDIEHSKNLLFSLISNHLVLVYDDGEKKGFIAGMITPHHFNPKIKVLCELLWWVGEKHRMSGAGKALLDAFIDFGKSNCDWITFTMEDKTPVKDSALLSRGFHFKEKTFLLEV